MSRYAPVHSSFKSEKMNDTNIGSISQERRYRKLTRNTFIAFLVLIGLFLCSGFALGRHVLTSVLCASAMMMPVVLAVLEKIKSRL